MTRKLDITSMSRGDRARAGAYLRDFLPAMIGYVVVVLLVTTIGGLQGHNPLRFVWALLPAVPTALLVRAVVRHLRRVDEWGRLQLLTAAAVGFAAAMLAAVVLGFLSVAGLALPPGMASFGVVIVGMVAFGVAAGVQAR